MARQITIDSQERIEIVNSEGTVTGSFLFNPSDVDILKRCEQVAEYFKNLDIPESEDVETFLSVGNDIRAQFDFLLNTDSSTLFEKCNPLSPRENGEIYCEYVLNAIIGFMERELKTRFKKSDARMKKHTAKYAK